MNRAAATWRPIGPMVELLVKAHGSSLGEVADHLDIHRNTLTEKVHGRRPFTEDEIQAIAELFRVSPGRLFDDPMELLGVSPAPSGRSSATKTSRHARGDLPWATDTRPLVEVRGLAA